MAGKRERGVATAVALLAALQLGLGLIAARIYLSTHHSLYNNGNWVATKTTLEEGVMGAHSYLFTLQPLSRGRLDLTAWHGFQEVVLAREVEPATVEFDFQLKPGAWLAFEYHRTDAGYSGVRVSRHPSFPPIAFEASPAGEFLEKRPVEKLGRARAGRRTLRLELRKERSIFFLDGRRVAVAPGGRTGPQRIGFRAGHARAWIDDLEVVERDGAVLRDGFDRPRQWLPVYLLALALPPALSAALFGLLARRGVDPRRLLLFLLMFSGLGLVLAAIAWGYVSYSKGFYPDASERLRREEAYWREELEESIFARIAAEHPPTPAPGIHRILFLGSSQTRGAGARTRDETFVRQTEAMLDERAGGDRFECINAGVSAYRLADMARVFDERWAALAPRTVVVNAGNNDQGGGARAFERTLVSLVRRARQAGARVVLVMEPNSIELDRPVLRQLHQVMAQVARREGAEAVDLHGALARRHDEGFLWWDWVHLTSFGQRLFAEELVDELVKREVVSVEPAAAAGR